VVHYLHDDAEAAVALLAHHGVALVSTNDVVEDQAVAGVLSGSDAEVRADVVLAAPDDQDADSGVGAWHINNEHEAHTVVEGRGVIEFWCGDRSVAAVLEAGDIMLVRGAEHRYRPLTDQRWLIRYSGGPESELTPTETGRPSAAWPVVD
jgi:mannose-6-phosphate isomerase-like protein (cupin superfamily)